MIALRDSMACERVGSTARKFAAPAKDATNCPLRASTKIGMVITEAPCGSKITNVLVHLQGEIEISLDYDANVVPLAPASSETALACACRWPERPVCHRDRRQNFSESLRCGTNLSLCVRDREGLDT